MVVSVKFNNGSFPSWTSALLQIDRSVAPYAVASSGTIVSHCASRSPTLPTVDMADKRWFQIAAGKAARVAGNVVPVSTKISSTIPSMVVRVAGKVVPVSSRIDAVSVFRSANVAEVVNIVAVKGTQPLVSSTI